MASLGRLVDIRNFPDTAADVLLGRATAFLGRGLTIKRKALDPTVVGALVFWTKGPVDLLIDCPGLREVLETYNGNQSVVGLQLTVTGLGGTFLEPGIEPPEKVAAGLEKVLNTGLIEPEAVLLRYDPLLTVRTPDGRIVRNDTRRAFESVVPMFSKLGVRNVVTKPLLLGEQEDEKYHHVWQRMMDLGIHPLPLDDFETTFFHLRHVAVKYEMTLFSCCMKHAPSNWAADSGCLSAQRLTRVGKKRFGQYWNRLSSRARPSRVGCECSKYFDLSSIKGHKKCGSQDAACVYCSASCKKFGATIQNKIEREIEAYRSCARERYYEHLL